jgi:hypothetical protein
MADELREIGRTQRAAERIAGWAAEARPQEAAALWGGHPPRDLAMAVRRLARAAERLVQVDRERAIEEADIALRDGGRRRGDEALICDLVQGALALALTGSQPSPAAALGRPARLQVIA